MSDSLQPHGLQHRRPPCPSPSPGACSNSGPLSGWCHPTVLSSVVPFCHTVALTSHSGKVMLKNLHARLQLHVNQELPDVQDGFRKGRGTRDQLANIRWIIRKARESQKTSSFALLSMPKPLTLSITKDCGKFLKRWEYLTCLLRNLCAGQEATVRNGYGTTDWFQIGERSMSRLYIVTLLI